MTGKQRALEILKDFDTWCLCGKKECAKSENFIQALDSIEEVILDAEIELMAHILVQGATGRKRVGVSRDFIVALLANKQYDRQMIWESKPRKNQPNRGRWESK